MPSNPSMIFAAALAGLSIVLTVPQTAFAEDPIVFTARSGESIDALQGQVDVPEDRSDPHSRTISLSYVRFPATTDNPGPPIIYLAGGPGGPGSGTARGPRFALFMAMRAHGDVIAFDQRGTGGSTRLPHCRSSVMLADDAVISDADYAQAYRQAVEECGAFWRAEGIAIEAYNSAESVRDISDLRRHLGAEQVVLWGISYGSHLALAALKDIPDEIDRVIIASAEGLDQTVKMPASTDAYIARLQAAVDTQPAARAAYPDIAGLIRRVHARLESDPIRLEVPQEDGSVRPYLLERRKLQEFSSGLISDPQYAAIMLALYASLDAGDTGLATGLAQRFATLGEPIGLSGMPTAMDLASGISEPRLMAFREQAETALFGPYLNFPMPQIRGAWDGFDLGDAFRTGPVGDTPVLLLTGTLDGRTYPQAQADAVAGLGNVTQIIVRNAGHNLFMTSPEVHAAMHRFMRAESVETEEIVVDLPDFTQLPF